MKTIREEEAVTLEEGGVRRWRRVLVGLVPAAIALGWLGAWAQPERLVPVGTPVRFDDFAFSVAGSREMVVGDRRYLVVALTVQNQAKRATYQFRREVPVLVDDDGREYGLSESGQRIVDQARGGADPLAPPLPAGASATTELAFPMPEKATNLRVRLEHASLPPFNAIDDLLLRKPRLKVK